ncbi:MAG: hypothetical protein JWN59_378 [Sphingomonas bacterium]|jgi:hypothetical protein|nr:hypothetical protein [Sphingomonas bacterium]
MLGTVASRATVPPFFAASGDLEAAGRAAYVLHCNMETHMTPELAPYIYSGPISPKLAAATTAVYTVLAGISVSALYFLG